MCRHLANTDEFANRQWKRYFTSRWKVSSYGACEPSWHILYGSKMQQVRSWAGRYQVDQLHGHTKGVRCCKLLPQHNLLATGSIDKTVRLWDLSAGMPLATSKSHGGTVRCIALDSHALASGAADNTIRVWLSADVQQYYQDKDHDDDMAVVDEDDDVFGFTLDTADVAAGHSRRASPTLPACDNTRPMFELGRSPQMVLRGHTGPVSALTMTQEALYSGSWDYSVRIWQRDSWPTWTCASVLTFDDWVGCVAVRGGRLLVAAGPMVYVHDTCTGQVIRRFQDLHEGHVSCLEGTHDGHLLFTGAVDGLVLAHDLRMKESTTVLWHHNASVQSLSYEDPWLATASADGTVVLINTENCIGYKKSGLKKAAGAAGNASSVRATGTNCRQLQTNGGPAYCVDISEQYLVCGSESDTVRVWDFTRANEVAARAVAAKAARANSKAARQSGHARHKGAAASSGPGMSTAIGATASSAAQLQHTYAHTYAAQRLGSSPPAGVQSLGATSRPAGPNTSQRHGNADRLPGRFSHPALHSTGSMSGALFDGAWSPMSISPPAYSSPGYAPVMYGSPQQQQQHMHHMHQAMCWQQMYHNPHMLYGSSPGAHTIHHEANGRHNHTVRHGPTGNSHGNSGPALNISVNAGSLHMGFRPSSAPSEPFTHNNVVPSVATDAATPVPGYHSAHQAATPSAAAQGYGGAEQGRTHSPRTSFEAALNENERHHVGSRRASRLASSSGGGATSGQHQQQRGQAQRGVADQIQHTSHVGGGSGRRSYKQAHMPYVPPPAPNASHAPRRGPPSGGMRTLSVQSANKS